jgi:hypothetical protein
MESLPSKYSLWRFSDKNFADRYGGKAAVCFAGGRIALVVPEDAENLMWKP